MTDRKKVIRGLETCSHADEVGCDQCPYYGTPDCQSVMQTEAYALLREQEPVEPYRSDGLWCCGECHKNLWYYRASYCPTCGRAVKWDD